MSQMTTGPGSMEGGSGNSVYTILIIVAAVFVWTAAIFTFIRVAQMYGSVLPPAGG